MLRSRTALLTGLTATALLLTSGIGGAVIADAPTFIGPPFPADQPDCRPFTSTTPPVQRPTGITPRQWQSVVGLPTVIEGTPAAQRIVILERSQNADLAGVAQLLTACGISPVTITEVGDVGNPNAGEATLDAAVVAAGAPPNTEVWMANSNSSSWATVIAQSAEACGIDTSATPPVKRTVAVAADKPAWPAGGCIITASYSDNESQYFPNPSTGTQEAIALLDALESLGVIVVFSAGDESSGGCSTNATTNPYTGVGLTTRFPTSHPGVLGVGGTQWDDQATSMSIGRNQPYTPGASYSTWVWKDNVYSAKCANVGLARTPLPGGTSGGGGKSTHFALPEYQRAAAMRAYPGNPGKRLVPDVVALAMWPDYALIRNGAWELSGGTSAAAPSVAVGIANVNASLSARGLPIIDNAGGSMDIHNLIYDTSLSSVVSDVTQGNNDLFGFDGSTVMPGYDPALPAWVAQAGYDMASGIGVINFTNLLNALIARFTSSQGTAPSPWFQAIARPSATAACQTGWRPSWAQWPNGGEGGWTCERTLRWVSWSLPWQAD
jgi:subtilase family serine protease